MTERGEPAELRRRLHAVRVRIDAAATNAGRAPGEVRLLPVTKTVPAARLRDAYAAGMTEFGENKVQEAAGKADELSDLDVGWVLIGHLQTNKAKDVAAFAREFQALDSTKVAAALDRRLEPYDRTLDVLVQVNTSGEDSKFGVPPDAAPELVRELQTYDRLRVRGLMTLAVFSDDEDRVRTCFRTLRCTRDRAQDTTGTALPELSMGMSGDFEWAIAEGATTVRVGTAIFGDRPRP